MTDSIPTVAMIFAAGRGRRMQPLSDVLPKPALPVPGGPVVSWALRLVAQCGIPNAVLNSWWLAQTMEQTAIEAAPQELSLCFSREEHLMDTGGGLALARDRGLLGTDGPVLVVNGDGILNLDLEGMFRRHRETDDLITLGLLPHLGPKRWSRVLLDRDDLVSAILPPGTPAADEVPLLYPGVMLIAREALETLETTPSGVASTLWAPARKQARLGGVLVTGHWREVGAPEDYLEATMVLLGDRNDLDSSARVAPDAMLQRTLVGPEVTIGRDAVIGRSIISHGAMIGAGARVIRSVLLGDVRVEAGETVTDEVRTCAPLKGGRSATDHSRSSTGAF
ncbi:MAG: NDP-sugar synthase [Acidobacteria bacterium]|nr:NDP-sugar synthase [Acidobacteriota bacterium]